MKKMLMILPVILFIGISFGQEKDANMYSYTYKISADEVKDLNVTCNVDDNVCTVTVKKNGEIKTFSFPLDDKEGREKIVEELEDMDIDLYCIPGKHQKVMIKSEKSSWLGVQVQALTDQLREYFKIKGDDGVLVSEVFEDSPAEEAGLKAGDVIISVDRKDVENHNDLVQIIRDKDPGEKVKIKIVRNGKKEHLSAVLDEREMKESMMHSPEKFSFLPHKRSPMLWNYKFDDDDLEEFELFHEKSNDLKKEMESLRDEIENLKKDIEELKKD